MKTPAAFEKAAWAQGNIISAIDGGGGEGVVTIGRSRGKQRGARTIEHYQIESHLRLLRDLAVVRQHTLDDALDARLRRPVVGDWIVGWHHGNSRPGRATGGGSGGSEQSRKVCNEGLDDNDVLEVRHLVLDVRLWLRHRACCLPAVVWALNKAPAVGAWSARFCPVYLCSNTFGFRRY